MDKVNQLVTVVIPVFNEEEVLEETLKCLLELRQTMSPVARVEFLFVDDGSDDKSLSKLREFASNFSFVKVISFSRNFGHQIAITAGIDFAKGDFVAVIDADLQDPPEVIAGMYRLATERNLDVVYGKRSTRKGETLFKRLTASIFYRGLNFFCDFEIPEDTGDFRLMSRRVVDSLGQMREKHRFIRGMVPWVGFESAPFEYVRAERFAGSTKYPLKKMLRFAADAAMSFSRRPLVLATRLGLTLATAGFFGAAYILYLKIVRDLPTPGLTTTILAIIFFSGVQISLIGLVGSYTARIFEEIKGRPLYVIKEKIND